MAEDQLPALMHGPAFHDESPNFVEHFVERVVPFADIKAFEKAGYVRGGLPEHLKPKVKPEPEAPKKGK